MGSSWAKVKTGKRASEWGGGRMGEKRTEGPRGRGEHRNVDNGGQHIQSLSGIISGPSDMWYKTLS